MHSTTIGALFVLAGCIFAAFCAIELQYLESVGLSWAQTLFLCQVSGVLFCIIFTFLFQMHNFYQLTITNRTDDGVDNYNSNATIIYHVLSIFPSNTKNNYMHDSDNLALDTESTDTRDKWQALWSAGVSWGLAMQFFTIGLLYLSGGDCLSIRTITSVFGLILAAIIFFKEKIPRLVYVALGFSVVGILLVCQPLFIFGNCYYSLSVIGLTFVFIAGLCQTINKSVMKYSGNINIHWLAMAFIELSCCLALALVGIIVMIVYYYYLYFGDGNKSMGYIWDEYIWYDLNKIDEFSKFILVIYGPTMVANKVCMVYGFQKGSLGKVSIVYTSDIPLTYMLQDWLLNEHNNYITYIGAAVIVISVVIIFMTRHSDDTNTNNTISNNTNSDKCMDGDLCDIDDPAIKINESVDDCSEICETEQDYQNISMTNKCMNCDLESRNTDAKETTSLLE